MNSASYGKGPDILCSVSGFDQLAAHLRSNSACSSSCERTYGAHGHHNRMQPLFHLADHGNRLLVRPPDITSSRLVNPLAFSKLCCLKLLEKWMVDLNRGVKKSKCE